MCKMELSNDTKMLEYSKDVLSITDDEDEEEIEDENQLPEMTGTLSKWTNYIHGWQDRYIVLKDGTLSYYKSENETGFGCRGAVSLTKAVITDHEFDECRIDVSVNDCLWYLRCKSEDERQSWLDMLELHRQADSGYGSENNLRRHGSMMSLASGASLSTASASSFKRGRGLREKLAEMETFRDILCRQVDTLQNYFDACASALEHYSAHVADIDDDIDDINTSTASIQSHHYHTFNQMEAPSHYRDIINILQQHGAHAIDFKGESFTFKATTAGILATLSHTLELMSQREETWRKRIDRETEKRKKYEEAYKTLVKEKQIPVPAFGGPDYEEGPHSKLNEDEFFDAIDSQLDQLEKEEEKRKKIVRNQESEMTPAPITSVTCLDAAHPLYEVVNRVVSEHLETADMTLSNISDKWTLVAEDGDMKVYKRELEEDGMVVDPLKAVITVKGITGHELCHYFWEPKVRMEWESTLEASNVVEWLSKDTMVTHQVHKRIWPASQRDSLFWSTIRHCPAEDDEGPDYWLVVNHSTEHPAAPANTSKCVRIRFNVAMICQTVVQPPESGQQIARSNLTCKIQYSANVNPGGWAPASVIRAISKRELPKFLKTFTTYVQETTASQPILF